jgi:predicted PurR-regulated permease PerM
MSCGAGARRMNLNLTTATRIGLNILALLAGIVSLRLGETIFIPLVIALLLATILWPSAHRLNTFYRLPWPVACVGAVMCLVVLNLVVMGGFVIAIPRLLQDVPQDEARQQKLYKDFRDRLEQVSPVPLDPKYFPDKASESEAFNYVANIIRGTYITDALVKVLGYIANWAWQFVLVLFIILFLLMEGRMLTRRVTEVFGPSAEVRAKVVETLTEMTTAVRTYLIWRTIINIVLAVVVGAVYQAMGLHQAWTWALLVAILNYVPYLGPIIAGIPPILDAFVHVGPWTALAVVVFFTLVVTIEGYLIVPVVMGRNMDLNATTVMLACLFWDLVWGTPGLFLAMPLMAAIKSICDHVPGWKPWANLMSAREADVPAPARVLGDGPDRTVLMDGAHDGPVNVGERVTR